MTWVREMASLAKRLRLSSQIPAVINMFKVPGHMESWEILTRGSAFPVKWRNRTRWLTSRHVTHPQMHADSYYVNDDVEWLNDVKEDMTRHHLEWRTPDGSILRTASVARVIGHRDLDVAELIFSEKERKTMLTPGFNMLQEEEEEGGVRSVENKELLFVGHNLNVDIDDSTGDDLGNMVPNTELGISALASGFRMVCKTEETLQMGMCGGVCMLLGEKNDDMVVGMIEGILPGVSEDAAQCLEDGDDIPPKRVADVFPSHAVVLGNRALCTFLDDNDKSVV